MSETAQEKHVLEFPLEYDPERDDSDISKLHLLMKEQKLKEADVVVWSAGDLNDRNQKCINLIQSNYAPTLLLSSGLDNPEIGSIRASKMRQRFVDSGVNPNRIVLEDESRNTKEQAVNVIQIAARRKWKKIILVANPYHQMRLFLTFLAELKKQKLEDQIELINAPADLNWFQKTSRGREEIEVFSQEEIRRMIDYNKKGDVAKPSEGIEYLEKIKNKLLNG